MISPLRPTILRAKTIVQTLVTLLTTGSTITSGVGLPGSELAEVAPVRDTARPAPATSRRS